MQVISVKSHLQAHRSCNPSILTTGVDNSRKKVFKLPQATCAFGNNVEILPFFTRFVLNYGEGKESENNLEEID